MTYKTSAAAQEIGRMPNGLAVLRVLEAYGINQLVCRDFQTGALIELTTIDMMIADAARVNATPAERRRSFLEGMVNFARGGSSR